MKIRPASTFLLIRMRSLQTDSSIVLPDTVAPLHPHGEVLSLGPDCKTDCGGIPKINVGDLVLFLPQNITMGFNESMSDECFLLPEAAVVGWYVPDTAVEGLRIQL